MSRLPKKKSRKIIVDGRTFRWMLHGRNRYIGSSPLSITISIQEDIEKPGSTLQCLAISKEILKREDYRSNIEEYCTSSIFPSDIEKIIKAGLNNGWDPAKGSGTFSPGNLELNQYTV